MSISHVIKNNGTLNCFRKTFSENFRRSFSYTTPRALSNHNEENEKNFAEVFNYGALHIL